MGFLVSMDKNQYNVKLYHWIIERLPATFTFQQAQEVIQKRYALSKATEKETKGALRKMKKLAMITCSRNNNYEEAVYNMTDLYQRHYKKGNYTPNKLEDAEQA